MSEHDLLFHINKEIGHLYKIKNSRNSALKKQTFRCNMTLVVI